MRNHALYLKDIVEAMNAIERFVDGMDLNEFRNNDMISSAVIRKFEIVGEAAKNIPADVRDSYPEIPWKEMAGMRDRLIHFYFGVKYDLVWQTIKDVIPVVKKQVINILEGGSK